jgi:hypothetical protein
MADAGEQTMGGIRLQWITYRAFLLAMSAAIAPFTAAQSVAPAPAAEEEVEDNIVITGRRDDADPLDIMLDFVNELGDPISRGYGFARLESDLCIKVHNVVPQVGDYLVARMSTLALELGMKPQKPECKPNLDIIFTTDGKAMAAAMRKNQMQLLRPFGNTEGTTQGLHALEDFVNSEAAVRWWQITLPVDYAGNVAVKLPNADAPPTIVAANSNVSRGVRDRLLGTLVIVDIPRLGEVSWLQLADYVAMVALAQVDPTLNLAGYDSILNLFGSGRSTAELTAWDKAYLEALYSINRHIMPRSQKGQLANQVLRKLEENENEDE